MHDAIACGREDLAFKIIQLAPETSLLNIQNDDAQAPIHCAAIMGQPKTVKFLITQGANV